MSFLSTNLCRQQGGKFMFDKTQLQLAIVFLLFSVLRNRVLTQLTRCPCELYLVNKYGYNSHTNFKGSNLPAPVQIGVFESFVTGENKTRYKYGVVCTGVAPTQYKRSLTGCVRGPPFPLDICPGGKHYAKNDLYWRLKRLYAGRRNTH
jgi:hypothetical protein